MYLYIYYLSTAEVDRILFRYLNFIIFFIIFFSNSRKWKRKFKTTRLHLKHHLSAPPISVFPPSPPSTSRWCGHLSIKRGWVSHLPCRPLIVWHTAAQHGCQSLYRAWIRWLDYHSTRFHFPHSPVLPWKQITCNLHRISQTTSGSCSCHFHNTRARDTTIWACWLKGFGLRFCWWAALQIE